MENLYSDLDNYDEVHIVDELRTENTELKLKLEEYKTAIGKLQKDYDKLVLEFNNLQANYSSLLKTARAEVERKAHTISQLNTEKDIMILKALQNGNNRFRNSVQKSNTSANKTSDLESSGSNKKGKKKRNKKKNAVKSESISSNPPVPTTEQAESTKLNIVDTVVDKVEECISKGELKENVPQCKPPHEEPPKACGIKSRRQTLPAVSVVNTSSDEDVDFDKITNPSHKKVPPPANIASIMNIRIPKLSERLGSKTSETTTTASEKSSIYQEHAKEDHRSRPSRQSDPDKYRDNTRFRGRSVETDKYREDDKFNRVGNRDRKSDNIRQDEQTGDKYRQGNKFRESDKWGEGSKFRDRYKWSRDSKSKEDQRFRDHEQFRDNEERYDVGRSRHFDKHRTDDKNRDSDKYTDFSRYRDGEKSRDSDRYGTGDRYRDIDKFNEGDKYRDTDKSRTRTRFDPPYRPRRHYSPDRPYKRNFRESQDDYRSEYRRPRDSPPPEPHSLNPQRSRSPHLHYENPRHKNEHRQDLPNTESQALHHDSDEPLKKRQKVEHATIPIDDRRTHHRPPYLIECDMMNDSCQSPDAAFSPDPYAEPTHAHVIKEIKTTAVMPLEDPRVLSKKYVLQTENGTNTLSTAASKCINMKPLNKSQWNVKTITIPDALMQRSEAQLDLDVKQIYMDIENLETNVSLESGEILDNVSQNVNNDINTKCNSHDNDKIVTDEILTQNNKVQRFDSTQKISKVMPDYEHIKNQVPNVLKVSEITDKNVLTDNQNSTSQTELPNIDQNVINVAPSNFSNVTRKDKPTPMSLSEIAMVQDDLHLSDENSDNVDTHKQVVTDVEQFYGKISVEASIIDLGGNIKYDYEIKVDAVDNIKIGTDDKLKESKTHRKHKNKKGKKNEEGKVSEKKSRPKKDKLVKSKQTKNKFTDLFGDSNSLITPEDLGIPATCVPLCEDAQDAVDVNIKDITSPPPECPVTENVQHEIQIQKQITEVTNRREATVADKAIVRTDGQVANPTVITNNTIFPNLNADIGLNKPEVTAVVISSGVQSQFTLSNEGGRNVNATENTNANSQNIFDMNLLPAGIEYKKHVSLKALATSTPHKDHPIVETIETAGTDRMNVSSDNKSEDTKESGTDTSITNSNAANDAPDVRIFVRRRRKVVKKT